MWTALDAALPAIDHFVGRQLLYTEVIVSIFIAAAIIIILLCAVILIGLKYIVTG